MTPMLRGMAAAAAAVEGADVVGERRRQSRRVKFAFGK